VLYAELRDAPPPHWLVCAGPGADPALVDELVRKLPARWAGPLCRPPEPGTFLARSLAGRALRRGRWRCNLRAGGLAHPLVAQWQQRVIRRAAAVLLAAGLVLLAGNLCWQTVVQARAQRLQTVVAALAAQLAPDARIPYGQEVAEAQRALAERTQAAAPVLEALRSELYVRTSALIETILAAGAACQQLQTDNAGFALRGAAADWDHCERLAQRIRALGFTTQIEALPGLDDGRAAFKMQGKWKP